MNTIAEQLKLPERVHGLRFRWSKSLNNAVSKLRRETGKDIVTCRRKNDLIVLYLEELNIEDRRR